MSNAAETDFQRTTQSCSVAENWCKRFCLALHPIKLCSVSKSIFTMHVIDATIIFKNTKLHRQKPAIACVLTDFVRVTTLPSTALQHR
jgi:hypothetical protein